MSSERMIKERYRLLERLGSGGMGTVSRAYDERLRRTVAVKEVHVPGGLTGTQNDELVRRTMREGRIAARLHHPQLITVYDVIQDGGRPYLIMEYFPSHTLAAVGTVPYGEAAWIGAQAADALASAHASGVVHRDIKPANILVGEDGGVKITDFGVSRVVEDLTATMTGMFAGTPAYVAPEVAKGEQASFASDVYSLGATMYALIEGASPAGDGTNPMAVLYRIARGEINRPRRAGPLTDVLMWLLSKDPTARPTMTQASHALATNATKPTSIVAPTPLSTVVLPAPAKPGTRRSAGGQGVAAAGAAAKAPTSTPSPADSTAAGRKPTDSTPAEPTPASHKPANSTAAGSKPGEATPADTELADSTSSESTPAERKSAEVAFARPEPAESALVKAAPASSVPGEVTPADTEPVDSTSSDSPKSTEPTPTKAATTGSKPTEVTPASTELGDPTSSESTPADPKSIESEPADTAPAGFGPGDSAPAKITTASSKPTEVTPADTEPDHPTSSEPTPAEPKSAGSTRGDATPAKITTAGSRPTEATPARTGPADSTSSEPMPAEPKSARSARGDSAPAGVMSADSTPVRSTDSAEEVTAATSSAADSPAATPETQQAQEKSGEEPKDPKPQAKSAAAGPFHPASDTNPPTTAGTAPNTDRSRANSSPVAGALAGGAGAAPQTPTSAGPVAGSPPAPTLPGPVKPSRARRMRAIVVAAGLIVVAVVAAVITTLVNNDDSSRDPNHAAPPKRTTTTTTGNDPSPAEPSAGTTTDATTTTQPTQPSQPKTEQPPPQQPAGGSTPAQAVTDYYALMPGNLDAAWPRLSPKFQGYPARGRSSFGSFWSNIRSVAASDVAQTGDNVVEVTLLYTYNDGHRVRERHRYTLVDQNGSWLIDTVKVLSSGPA